MLLHLCGVLGSLEGLLGKTSHAFLPTYFLLAKICLKFSVIKSFKRQGKVSSGLLREMVACRWRRWQQIAVEFGIQILLDLNWTLGARDELAALSLDVEICCVLDDAGLFDDARDG
jgi:hypothetical protein